MKQLIVPGICLMLAAAAFAQSVEPTESLFGDQGIPGPTGPRGPLSIVVDPNVFTETDGVIDLSGADHGDVGSAPPAEHETCDAHAHRQADVRAALQRRRSGALRWLRFIR